MQRIPQLNLALEELQRLRRLRVVLSDTLSNHAARLKSTGALPPEDLLSELLDYRDGLSRLSADLSGDTSNSAPDDTAPPELNLDAAQAAIDLHVIRQRVGTTLQRIATLVHIDDAGFAPLAKCRSQASQLLQSLETGSAVNPAVVEADFRPFQGLLTLLESPTDLSDADWATNHEMVTATWGRALSTAIARGKIGFSADTPCDVEPAQVTEATPECQPTISNTDAEVIEPTSSQTEAPPDSIFDTIGESCTERSPSRSYRSRELKLLADEPFRWIRSAALGGNSPVPASATTGIPILAQHALEATPENQSAQLGPVILQLLAEDRPALAYYLRQALDAQSPGSLTAPPTWLIHTLTLCRQMCYSRGEIARQIEADLECHTPELAAAGDAEHVAATGFFLRAAALLPALLNASPAATRILKSFRILPGLSHIYNYCGRIVSYGQQLQGQAADLFTPDCDADMWSDELDELQRSVEAWMAHVVNQHCPAIKTSPLFLHAHWTLMSSAADRHAHSALLWSKWQETFRIVQGLLDPIRMADESQRYWLKTEIERLSAAIRVESAARQYETQSVALLLFPDEQMIVVIRQAMAHANRWLRLCASKPNQGRTLVSRDAEYLRDEILERTDSVLEELTAYGQFHASPPITASIVCLCRIIEHLRLIFSPQSTLALREPDPQEVLMTELLPVPHLELNAAGHPLLNPEQLTDTLLRYLRDTEPEIPQKFSALSAALELRAQERLRRASGAHRQHPQNPHDSMTDSEPTDTCWE